MWLKNQRPKDAAADKIGHFNESIEPYFSPVCRRRNKRRAPKNGKYKVYKL